MFTSWRHRTAPAPPPAAPPPNQVVETGGCDSNYTGGCVPPYPPDLDCRDVKALGIATPVRVVGADPHRLDGDGDRLGCER